MTDQSQLTVPREPASEPQGLTVNQWIDLYKWAADQDRKPPESAFTSGLLRDAATAVFLSLPGPQRDPATAPDSGGLRARIAARTNPADADHDLFWKALEEAGHTASKLPKPIASIYISNDGKLLQIHLDTSRPYYGDWIKGEGAGICLMRDQETKRVVGATLPLYAKCIDIGGDKIPDAVYDIATGAVIPQTADAEPAATASEGKEPCNPVPYDPNCARCREIAGRPGANVFRTCREHLEAALAERDRRLAEARQEIERLKVELNHRIYTPLTPPMEVRFTYHSTPHYVGYKCSEPGQRDGVYVLKDEYDKLNQKAAAHWKQWSEYADELAKAKQDSESTDLELSELRKENERLKQQFLADDEELEKALAPALGCALTPSGHANDERTGHSLALEAAKMIERLKAENEEYNRWHDRVWCESLATSSATLKGMFAAANAAREAAELRAKHLESAIREHWEQANDDRCWEDDVKLYAAVPLPESTHHCIGDPALMLENCKRFIEQRCVKGGTWQSYADMKRERDELRQKLTNAAEVVRGPCELGEGDFVTAARWDGLWHVSFVSAGDGYRHLHEDKIAIRLPAKEGESNG